MLVDYVGDVGDISASVRFTGNVELLLRVLFELYISFLLSRLSVTAVRRIKAVNDENTPAR